MISLYAASGEALRTVEPEEDVDPMSSVANIADAMLVFACGLMVALVVAWNVDLQNVQEIEIDSSEQIEDLQSLEDLLTAEGSSYIQRGTVYQDPNTGQMYLLEDGAGQSGADSQQSAEGRQGQAAGSGGSSNAGSEADGS